MKVIKKIISEYFVVKGNSMYHKKRFEDSLNCFTRAMNIEPSCGNSGINLSYIGKCHYYLGNYNQASDFINRSISFFEKKSSLNSFEKEELRNLYAFAKSLKERGNKGDTGNEVVAFPDGENRNP